MIDWLIMSAKDLNLWVRERVPFTLKAEAVLLVLYGLSLAQAVRHLGMKGFPVARQKVGKRVQEFHSNYPNFKHTPPLGANG